MGLTLIIQDFAQRVKEAQVLLLPRHRVKPGQSVMKFTCSTFADLHSSQGVADIQLGTLPSSAASTAAAP